MRHAKVVKVSEDHYKVTLADGYVISRFYTFLDARRFLSSICRQMRDYRRTVQLARHGS